jgi:DNA-binding GntR family transcriptional regulator
VTDTPGSARIPASASTASDRAYAYVKERILSGELEGGSLISEGEIAEALQMSRTPVREAFLRLQTEGWMKLYPKRGASITPIKPRESDDVIEARALLETHAVSTLAAERAGELADRLRAIIDRQQEAAKADDLTGFAAADADFHAAIAASGGNELLTEFYLGLRDRQRRMTRDSVQRSPGARDRILDQHRRLVELISAGDAEAFGAEISKHLDDIHRR